MQRITRVALSSVNNHPLRIIAILFVIMFFLAPAAQAQTATSVAYTTDPNTPHFGTYGSTTVVTLSGNPNPISILRNGILQNSAAPGGNPALMGGWDPIIDGAADGDIITINPGGASCVVRIVGPYRYCNVSFDTDGDGVYNHLDACVSEGSVGFGVYGDGCPIRDGDGDGIADNVDACPAQGSVGFGVYANGCPIGDGDGDGVPDNLDACPNRGDVYGLGIDSLGCPIRPTDAPTPTPRPENTPQPQSVQVTNTPQSIATSTPTPSPVTIPDYSKQCNLAPRPNGGRLINIRSAPLEDGENNVVTKMPQSGEGSGPYRVLAVSPDGGWYQIGTNVDSTEVKGWVAISETQTGGIDCGVLDTFGEPITPSEPSQREVNAARVEALVSPHIEQVFTNCPNLSPDYLALISNLAATDDQIAQEVAAQVGTTDANTCETVGEIVDEYKSTINAYSLAVCLSSANSERTREILDLAEQLGLLGLRVKDVCATFQTLSLLGSLSGETESFYNKLRNECQTSIEDALYILRLAIGQGVNLGRIVSIPEFCRELIVLIENPDYLIEDDLVERYPALARCDQAKVALFHYRITQQPPPLDEEALSRIFNANTPCRAMNFWMLYGSLPDPRPIVTPEPTPTDDTTGSGGSPQPFTPIPTPEAALTEQKEVGIGGVSWPIFNTSWIQASSYQAAFIADALDGQSTDLYIFANDQEIYQSLAENSPVHEKRVALSSTGNMAYIYANPDDTLGIRVIGFDGTVEVEIDPDWSLSSENLRMAWRENDLYFTLWDSQNKPAIWVWSYDDESTGSVIDGGLDPIVSGNWLVYKRVDTGNQFFSLLSDVQRNATRLEPIEQACEYTAFGTDELMAKCGESIHIVKFEGSNTQQRTFTITGQSMVRNLSRLPYTASYITWDDGNTLFYCKLDEASRTCNPVRFIALDNNRNASSLAWK
jgi:hypothetical protein